MAELTPREHLQPSLLDRLTDNKPAERLDTLEERVISFRKLRDSVIRDLEWLLNTGCLETTQDLSDYPEVRHSVLNFGIQDLSGMAASGLDSVVLERILREAITDFEPRILPDTLRIRVSIGEEKMSPNTIVFDISGELWWQPTPERLHLKTILDLEFGRFQTEKG